MKTLDQLEARTPVDATHTSGNSLWLYSISVPGSYYLTGNVNGVAGKGGIFISVSNVTLDLNGFSVIGVPGTGIGINVNGSHFRVFNGQVRSWDYHGLAAGEYASVDRITASGNKLTGIIADYGSHVSDCVVSANKNGINVSSTVVSHCVVYSNSEDGIAAYGGAVTGCGVGDNPGRGIYVYGTPSLVKDCTVTHNATKSGAGISVPDGSSVIDCVVDSNGFSSDNLAAGILGGVRTLVRGCNVTRSRGHGIDVSGDSTVVDNRSSKNGGDGIHSLGSRSRIEANQTRDNTGKGISVSTDDLVLRNASGGNTAGNFSPSAGSFFAPAQAPNATTNPNANIEF